MKRLIIITAAILSMTATKSLAQLTVLDIPKETKVGKAIKSFNKIAELSYTVIESDTTYKLSFEDYNYKVISQWATIKFMVTSSEIDGLHQILKDLFGSDSGSEKAFQLGDYRCLAKLEKTLGIKQLYVAFFYNDGRPAGLMLLEKNHINSLFGK